MEEKTDAELVGLALSGDKDDFAALIQRHEGRVRPVAARLAGDSDLAAELVQEATLQAYLSLEHLKDPSKFKSWLVGIVWNMHKDLIADVFKQK